MTTPAHYIRLLLLLAVCATAPPLQSQNVESGVIVAAQDTLESRIREVEGSSEIDETLRGRLLDLYRRALGSIEQGRVYEAATAEFVNARETAPGEAKRVREELKQLETEPPPALSDSLKRRPLTVLEQRLLAEKTELTSLDARRTELDALLEIQTRRAEPARERLASARRDRESITERLGLPVPEDEPPRLTEARRWQLGIEARTLAAEIEMLNQELLSQPMRIELLQARRDLLTLQATRSRQYVEALELLVIERRQTEARTARAEAEESERLAFGKHPLLQQFAKRNTELGEELNQMAAAHESVIQEENLIAGRAEHIANAYRLARQKLEIAGLNEALGQVLLQQRRSLPDTADFESARKRREQLVVESSLQQIRHRQERAELRDINAYVDEQLSELSESWQEWLREEVLNLARQRRELLDKAIAAEESYLQALGELEFAQREFAESVSAYSNFLDERLLWIRSGDWPSWQLLRDAGDSLGVFFSASSWSDLLRALFLAPKIPWIAIGGLLLFGLLLSQRRRLLRSLERSGRNVGQLRHDRLSATAYALSLTLLLALHWPILFSAVGLQLQASGSAGDLSIADYLSSNANWDGQFVPSVGTALADIALYSFYFLALRLFCLPRGLATVHFGWSAETCRKLGRDARWLMWVFLPGVFILIAVVNYHPAVLAGGLGRLVIVIILGALAWFFGRILLPRRGVLQAYYVANPGSPWTWGRYLWFVLGLMLPTVLAVLAMSGYVYTAAQFGERLVDTLWLLVALIFVHQLMVRWILLIERRLAFKDALERHRAQRAARAAENDGEEIAAPVEEASIDFGALSAETHKLINTALTVFGALGLWIIWADVFPAFRILDDVSLWSYTSMISGDEKIVPVTLGDVILGLLIIAIVLIAARRLPALIEILILSRLNISAGSRYAISTLTQYSIVAIGIVLVFNLLGGSWSEIQWLIAALGVGIGFGLQEIVANFICGLILLFERPIRIGDIVTVGDTSGVVTRIRIRSTTIRNWDQQELIVPNKEFITGRLLNWTLTDPVTRIVIPVGIAYGSDIELALRLIREAATAHERVLDEPAPLVTFDSFGDSALLLTLRCYIGSMDYRLVTISELNQDIERRFGEAGITIAFPQLDVHLDAAKPFEFPPQDAPAGA